MEMADALTHRGIAVTVVEHTSDILQTVDPDLGELVRVELTGRGVEVATGVAVKSISQEGESLLVIGSRNFQKTVDMVIVATGAAPEKALGKSAGLATGVKGAIRVDRKMATSSADIFAAGDCADTYHRLLRRNTYFPLGTIAHKQGTIAGENAVGGSREFSGTLGTQVVKIFGLLVARTGLREEEAKAAGYDPLSVDSDAWDHMTYYPGATRMKIGMTEDRRTGRLLGAQIIGRYGAEVSKRVDVLATALSHEMKVEELVDLDLSYTPPLSSPWDPVQLAAQNWSQQLRQPRQPTDRIFTTSLSRSPALRTSFTFGNARPTLRDVQDFRIGSDIPAIVTID
jgi:NADPH-dependent 2,4-dienoyl-CoA reductase/sulfur reductase-like enzyme